MKLAFTIPGRPVVYARVRGGKTTKHFTAGKQRTHMGLVRLVATAAIIDSSPKWPMGADYRLTVCAYVSHCKNGNRRKGDLSNYVKLVEDALNGVAYSDDCQVLRYSNDTGVYHGSEDERTEVVLETLG